MSHQRDRHPLPRIQLGPHFEAHPIVFPASAGIIVLAVLLCFLWPTPDLQANFEAIRDGIGAWFGWLYVTLLSAFLVLAIGLAASPYGLVRLGAEHERPEFRWWSWFAMLFSAGMGIGLLFFSVAEPIYHFQSPPPGYHEDWGNRELAMAVTMFHWGLHPWALYTMVGMMLAFAGFRLQLPLTFRSLLYPWLGDRVWGWAGDLVDIFAVIATLAGVATSLGIGAQQVNAGLNFLFAVPVSANVQVILITLITAVATLSVVAGLDQGIRRLSEFNMALAVLLMVMVMFGGGLGWFFRAALNNVLDYAQLLPSKSFRTGILVPESRSWLNSWTIFYWAWWISWSPFVGMFIARVSKGRTIREFVLGVMLVPTLIGLIWFSAFGNATLRQHVSQQARQDARQQPAAIESSQSQLDDAKKDVPATVNSNELFWIGVQDDQGQWERRQDGSIERYQESLTAVEYLSSPIVTADGETRVDTLPTVLFVMLEQMFGSDSGWSIWVFLAAGAATLCIVLFFVTSSDSASMVVDMMATGGNPNPPVGTRLFWAMTEGAVAAALLVAGGLLALQAAAVAAALPLALVLIAATYSFLRALHRTRSDMTHPLDQETL